MSRVKHAPASRKKRKRVLKLAKGARGGRSKLFRSAKETVKRALAYAYRDRKVKKRDFRSVWIIRIKASCKNHGILYSRFIKGLKDAKVELNRKMLSEVAVSDDYTFGKLVKLTKEEAK